VARAESPSVRDVQQVAAFRVVLRSFLRQTERVAQASRLTPQRYLLLLLVKGSERGDERATVSELAEGLHLAQSTVTELVNRAEQSGLVRRRVSEEDARVAYIELTPEGERRLAKAFRGLADERRALRKAISLLRD